MSVSNASLSVLTANEASTSATRIMISFCSCKNNSIRMMKKISAMRRCSANRMTHKHRDIIELELRLMLGLGYTYIYVCMKHEKDHTLLFYEAIHHESTTFDQGSFKKLELNYRS